MPSWTLTGYDRESGTPRTETLEAATQDEAVRDAGRLGMVVDGIHPVVIVEPRSKRRRKGDSERSVETPPPWVQRSVNELASARANIGDIVNRQAVLPVVVLRHPSVRFSDWLLNVLTIATGIVFGWVFSFVAVFLLVRFAGMADQLGGVLNRLLGLG